MSDAEARARIETSLAESLLVEAAAGTGKTTSLVRRVVAVIESGRAEPASLVVVTFTRKAAGELTLRLRDALDRRRLEVSDPVARVRLESAISHLEEARIGTIHGFCADLLRERPVEAGVDPGFVLLEDGESRRLFTRVFRRWLEEALDDLPPGVGRALDRLAARSSAESPLERLESAAWTLQDWRDHPAPWTLPPPGIDEASIVEQIQRLAKHAAKGPRERDDLAKTLEPVVEAAEWIARSQLERVIPPGQLEARLATVRFALGGRTRYRKKGRGNAFGAVPRTLVVAEREELVATLEDWGQRADARLVAELASELRVPLERFEQEKRRRGVLDFLDLQIKTRDLLVRDRSVRGFWQKRFTHLFVDEFQDVDPLQAEILLLLSSGDLDVIDWREVAPAAGKLFLVGDPKQSIYRFRRADVTLYRHIRAQLEEAGVGVVTLSRSFRVGARLEQLVNRTFETLLPGETPVHQADWVPLEGARDDSPDRPAVVVLPVPSVPRFPGGKFIKRDLEEQLPDLVASFVAWLIHDSGWQVPDGEGGCRPLAPRDVCLLFRKAWDFYSGDETQAFVRALERRGIAHLQSAGRSFFQREEVAALIAALTAIEWPDDELAVFAALRGPFAAIPDATLLRYRLMYGGLRPFAIPSELPEELVIVADALERLVVLHRARNRVPLGETVRALLSGSRAWAAFALRPAGGEVLAHLERVIDLARSFELSGGLSFRGFVDRLTEQADARGIEESPIREEGADGVRLMTAHSAKGLEFPVVVCADPLTSLARGTPDRWVDSERGLAAFPLLGLTPWDLIENTEESLAAQRAEGVRLAYVAATRARELLVLPSSGLAPFDDGAGWVAPLLEAVHPRRARDGAPDIAPGCPPLGGSTVSQPDPSLDLSALVVPGRHRLASGLEVVWWDPSVLDLKVPEPKGLEHDRIIASDAPPEAGAPWKLAWQEWKLASAEVVARGSAPTLRVATVTDQILPPPIVVPVVVERVGTAARQVGGVRFGTLVHTALRDVPLSADRQQVTSTVASLARLMLAPIEEERAAVEAVTAALAHPRLLAVAAAERVHHEWPFVMPLPDATEGLVEGVIDLAWLHDGRWTVLDFKTDTIWDPTIELSYRRQVAWYAWAVAAKTGMEVEAVVLRV